MTALHQIAGPAGTGVVVVDAHGEEVLGPAPAAPGVGAPSGLAAAVENGRSRPPGLVGARAEGGDPLMAAYAGAGSGWVVVLTQPRRQWQAGAARTAALVAGPLVLAWLLALGAVIVVEIRLARQAARMDEATAAFLAIAGHELRTPLTAIRGFSQMLAERGDALAPGPRHEVAEAIARQARVLEHQIERLLTAGRFETASQSPLALDPVDLGPLLQSVADRHRPLAPLHTIPVDAPEGVVVRGNAAALRQVFGELVDNAVKYSPAGGVVSLRVVPGRRSADVVVEDEGVGLPADFPRVFDRFGQLESVDTRTYDEGGMGLGLYIARSLLRQMDASISAQPRQPKGARFTVRLRRTSATPGGGRRTSTSVV